MFYYRRFEILYIVLGVIRLQTIVKLLQKMEEKKQKTGRGNNKDEKLKNLTNLRNNFARKLKKRIEYVAKEKLTELQRKKMAEKPFLEQMVAYFNGLLQKHKKTASQKYFEPVPELSPESKRILTIWQIKEKFDPLTTKAYLDEFPNDSGLHGFFTLAKPQNETEISKLLSQSDERVPGSVSTYRQVSEFLTLASSWLPKFSPTRSPTSPIAIVTPEEYQSLLQQSKIQAPVFEVPPGFAPPAVPDMPPPGFAPPVVPDMPPPGFSKPEDRKEETKAQKPKIEPEKSLPKSPVENPVQDAKDFVPIIGRKKKKGEGNAKPSKGVSKKGKQKYEDEVPGI